MAEYLNQREVLSHLGLSDYRSLQKWCKEATPEIVPRRRKGYGPARWYTGTQVRKLEKIAEAHGRAVSRPVAAEETGSKEDTESALLPGEEGIESALFTSLLERLEAVEGKIGGLGLPEGETLASFIQREVKRQIQQTRTNVAKVSLQSSEGTQRSQQ